MHDVIGDVLGHYVFMETDEKPEHDQGWLVEQRYRAVLEMLNGSPVQQPDADNMISHLTLAITVPGRT